MLVAYLMSVLQHFCSFAAFAPDSLACGRLVLFSQDHTMMQPDGNHYCGLCYCDCPHQNDGRWHKVGDLKEGDVSWIYLCKGCASYLWRLYAKGEYDEAAEQDPSVFYGGFALFLKQELKRLRSG